MAEREEYPKHSAINAELLRGDWVKRPRKPREYRCPICASTNAKAPDKYDYGICHDCGEIITG